MDLLNFDLLTGIQNLLQYINDNWTCIIIIIGLAISIGKKIADYSKKTDEEKIEIAKQQIKETMLKLVTDAEESYFEWVNAGGIKRSQVIDEIFAKYPVLSKVTNQEELIAWLDSVIDESLKIMREIFENQNVSNEDIVTVTSNVDTGSVTYATSGYISVE